MNLDMFSLDGRRALVTGAGRGLGQGVAIALGQAGAHVTLVARTPEQLEETAAQVEHSEVLAGDVLEGASIVERAEASGPIDIVVHCAGTTHRSSAVDFPAEEWERVIAVNLTAPFAISQELGRRQLARGQKGSHIFIASLAANIGLPNMAAYAASKTGLLGVVRALSTEWAGSGIRANAISPGYIPTALNKAVFDDPVRTAQLLARIPAGEFGTPAAIAYPAVFLASDASYYITGQQLVVDGGWMGA